MHVKCLCSEQLVLFKLLGRAELFKATPLFRKYQKLGFGPVILTRLKLSRIRGQDNLLPWASNKPSLIGSWHVHSLRDEAPPLFASAESVYCCWLLWQQTGCDIVAWYVVFHLPRSDLMGGPSSNHVILSLCMQTMSGHRVNWWNLRSAGGDCYISFDKAVMKIIGAVLESLRGSGLSAAVFWLSDEILMMPTCLHFFYYKEQLYCGTAAFQLVSFNGVSLKHTTWNFWIRRVWKTHLQKFRGHRSITVGYSHVHRLAVWSLDPSV